MALTHCQIANNCSLLEIVNILLPCPAIKKKHIAGSHMGVWFVRREVRRRSRRIFPRFSTGVLWLICLSSVWQLFVVSAGVREQVGHGPE